MVMKNTGNNDTEWICSVCGYVYEGDRPPAKCPVCGAKREYFDPVPDAEDAEDQLGGLPDW